jgi:hypothetical protein
MCGPYSGGAYGHHEGKSTYHVVRYHAPSLSPCDEEQEEEVEEKENIQHKLIRNNSSRVLKLGTSQQSQQAFAGSRDKVFSAL